MPRDKSILDEFEKHLSSEQKGVRDYLLSQRRAVQWILAVLVPFGFTLVGRLIDWQNLFSAANTLPGLVFLIFLGVQGFLVWTSLGWTPRLDKFAELSELRAMLTEVHKEARVYRDGMSAFGVTLAALRSPLSPDKDGVPPILNPEPGGIKFKGLSKEVLAVFKLDEVLRFLGDGDAPKQFCASLYWVSAAEGSGAQYELIDRRSTDDYKQVRERHEEKARTWAFGEAILGAVSKQRKPFVTADLQTLPGVPELKKRPYDGELYRGAMFARSNWFFQGDGVVWDGSSEKPPAFLLIFTSGEIEAFNNHEDLSSTELLIEAIRDLLDMLLIVAYKEQTIRSMEGTRRTLSGV